MTCTLVVKGPDLIFFYINLISTWSWPRHRNIKLHKIRIKPCVISSLNLNIQKKYYEI